jgi:hypothetical protein
MSRRHRVDEMANLQHQIGASPILSIAGLAP